jgi:hypothetical protein
LDWDGDNTQETAIRDISDVRSNIFLTILISKLFKYFIGFYIFLNGKKIGKPPKWGIYAQNQKHTFSFDILHNDNQ